MWVHTYESLVFFADKEPCLAQQRPMARRYYQLAHFRAHSMHHNQNQQMYTPTIYISLVSLSSFKRQQNYAQGVMVSQKAIQNQSNRDDEQHFPEDEILRYAAMMPRIIRFLFIIALQPIMPLRYFNTWSIGYLSSSNFHNPLADTDFRVDRLHGHNNIILPQSPKELIRKPINDHNISRFDSRLHRHSISIARRDQVLLNDVVGSNDGDYSKIGQYVFEHLDIID